MLMNSLKDYRSRKKLDSWLIQEIMKDCVLHNKVFHDKGWSFGCFAIHFS